MGTGRTPVEATVAAAPGWDGGPKRPETPADRRAARAWPMPSVDRVQPPGVRPLPPSERLRGATRTAWRGSAVVHRAPNRAEHAHSLQLGARRRFVAPRWPVRRPGTCTWMARPPPRPRYPVRRPGTCTWMARPKPRPRWPVRWPGPARGGSPATRCPRESPSRARAAGGAPRHAGHHARTGPGGAPRSNRTGRVRGSPAIHDLGYYRPRLVREIMDAAARPPWR